MENLEIKKEKEDCFKVISMETERLILRKFTMKDLKDFYEYARNENIGPKAGWRPHRNKIESRIILRTIINNKYIWAIYHKKDGKVIGSIGVHPDSKRDIEYYEGKAIGYVLSEEYWGQGLVVEAARELIQYCFNELGYKLLSVYHYDYNIQSKRVIEKLGFKLEGIIRMGSRDYNGNIYDTYSYSMTREEYLNSL